MRHLEIKENRKKLGMTQEDLAKKLGVSRKTIVNYENGEVIPETKRELLLSIFNPNETAILSEPQQSYIKKTGYEGRIAQIEERIKEHQKIIELSGKSAAIIEHHQEMIKLLHTQIEIIAISQKEFLEEQENFK